ncbi:YtxH domain-containing protein [Chitinophagaceae bacterium LWZ2-11]
MSTQKILIGTLAGLAAGVVVGILTAPAKGAETRQRIADVPSDLKKRFRRFRGQAGAELDELKEIFEGQVDGLKDDVRERVLKLIESTKQGVNHVKHEAMV